MLSESSPNNSDGEARKHTQIHREDGGVRKRKNQVERHTQRETKREGYIELGKSRGAAPPAVGVSVLAKVENSLHNAQDRVNIEPAPFSLFVCLSKQDKAKTKAKSPAPAPGPPFFFFKRVLCQHLRMA